MTAGPRVSVSVTTYNHERYIAQALDGVLMQETDFEYDVVVGDDCSTDGTRDIVLDYAARFPERVRPVLPEQNLGDGGKPMFIETIRHCRGALVAMLDGDDYWTAPDKLQRQVEFLDAHPDCSMVFHDALKVDESGARPPQPYSPENTPPLLTTADLLRGNPVASPTPMIRREVMTEFPQWYLDSPWGDWPLYLMAAECGQVGYVPEVMAVYRAHGAGAWSRVDGVQRAATVIAFYDTLDAGLRERHSVEIGHALAWRYSILARNYANVGHVGNACASLWRSLRLDPRARRTGYVELARTALGSCINRLVHRARE
jgi:glycosyltransferase involved in cell wall biosynthesis